FDTGNRRRKICDIQFSAQMFRNGGLDEIDDQVGPLLPYINAGSSIAEVNNNPPLPILTSTKQYILQGVFSTQGTFFCKSGNTLRSVLTDPCNRRKRQV